jgi:probable rRNA maturation factor
LKASAETIASVVAVKVRGGVKGISPATIRARAHKLLSALELNGVELSVVLCDDAFIHALNRDYRRKNKPTDVLSFPMMDEAGVDDGPGLMGDVIISVDTAKRQAAAAGHSLRRECAFLLIHGVLHLLGYTHENDRDEAKMNRETTRLLSLIEP